MFEFDVNTISQLIGSMGFPIVCCGYDNSCLNTSF